MWIQLFEYKYLNISLFWSIFWKSSDEGTCLNQSKVGTRDQSEPETW